MTQKIRYLALFLMLLSGFNFADNQSNRATYWQCTTEDGADKTWSAKNDYQKAALNIAFAKCKKESTVPATCKASTSNCEGFNLDLGNKASWRCTAIDEKAEAWRSNIFMNRDEAAFAARSFCKERSAVPETCYTNFVTCVNLNEGVSR